MDQERQHTHRRRLGLVRGRTADLERKLRRASDGGRDHRTADTIPEERFYEAGPTESAPRRFGRQATGHVPFD
ncbi:hypothetical protein D3C84_1218590 [compost metagenome]